VGKGVNPNTRIPSDVCNRPEVDARSRWVGGILEVERGCGGGEELGPHFDRDTSTGTDNAEVPIERHK
jgi:hypothetical protein